MVINQPSAGLPPGTLVNGRFRVKKLLGQGGYGNVYLVEDEAVFLGNQFALKESLSSTTSERRQFTREARWLMALEHPNLPRVLEQFEWNTRPCFVMAYISGENLEDRVDRLGPLPEDQVLEWMLPIADAVLYLHSQKKPIIHRDIKPGNIIVTKDGRPWLVDFGIAKVLAPSARSRKTTRAARAVSGGYSPLEQYTRGGTDARSDIYALGATLYHLLTGVCPPEAPDLAAGVVRLPEPRQFSKRISTQTEQAIMRAMRQKPEDRFQSVSELLSALPGGASVSTGSNAPQPPAAGNGKPAAKKGAAAPPVPVPLPIPPALAPTVLPPYTPPPPPLAATIVGPLPGAPQYSPPSSWAPPAASPPSSWVPLAPPAPVRVATGTQEFITPPAFSQPPDKQQPRPRRRRVVLASIVALLCGLAVVATLIMTLVPLLQYDSVPGWLPQYNLLANGIWLTALLVLTPMAALLLVIVPFFHWLGILGRVWTYVLLGLLPLVGLVPVIVWFPNSKVEVIMGLFAQGFYLPCLLFGLTWVVTVAQMIRGK